MKMPSCIWLSRMVNCNLKPSLSSSQSHTQAGFPSWIVVPGYIMSGAVCCENTNYKPLLDLSVGNTNFLMENSYFKILVWTSRFPLHKQNSQPDIEGLLLHFICQPQFRQEVLCRLQPRDYLVYSTLLLRHYLHDASSCVCCCWTLYQ